MLYQIIYQPSIWLLQTGQLRKNTYLPVTAIYRTSIIRTMIRQCWEVAEIHIFDGGGIDRVNMGLITGNQNINNPICGYWDGTIEVLTCL